ncbi:FTR1 family iron permease [Candidatus Hecatella orcuttiae]|jgi:high-affinity iron transporter|uniref:FTR1 family iron permease n=1 Tax=Candidatus Hecatella orcuttiae TaxID=1935119 RepID=UPI002867BE16|nr:FTR1 family protein [Candidatus Hecatella orcuttiae]
MLGQYLITFREVLEAALITAIILSYLVRTGRRPLSRYIWYGAYLAVALSLGLGASIWLAYGVLPKTVQVLFEATAAFVAVVVLSSMVYWMAAKGKYIKRDMERRIEAVVTKGAILGLVSIAFIVVFREGLETVLFLTPFLLKDALGTFAGIAAGTATALILSYGIFVAGMRINLHRFFYFTSILLILLAGGLAGYGVHELLEFYEQTGVEAGWLGEHAYTLNIAKGSLLHHKGILGSVLAVMFGYTTNAEWARIIVHLAYLAVAIPLVVWVYRKDHMPL